MRVVLLFALLLACRSALAAERPTRSFCQRLSTSLVKGGGPCTPTQVHAAAETMNLALRMQGAQAHCASNELAAIVAMAACPCHGGGCPG